MDYKLLLQCILYVCGNVVSGFFFKNFLNHINDIKTVTKEN